MGIGLRFMPAMTAAFAALEPGSVSRDAAAQRANAVGGSIGTAVLAVVLQRAGVGAHTPAAAAAGVRHRVLVVGGLTALAIIPCVVLMRAERTARARTPPTRSTPSGRRRVRRGGRVSRTGAVARGRRARRPGGRTRAAGAARSLVQARDGGGAAAARARDPPPGELSLRPVRAPLQPRRRAAACPPGKSRSPPSCRRRRSRRCWRHLEAAGLVQRSRSARGQARRADRVDGPRGRARVEARRARIEPLWRAALAPFGEAELLTAAAVLDRLAEHFDMLDAGNGRHDEAH